MGQIINGGLVRMTWRASLPLNVTTNTGGGALLLLLLPLLLLLLPYYYYYYFISSAQFFLSYSRLDNVSKSELV